MLQKEVLQKLRKQLPRNYTSILSKKCNCTPSQVINIISGRREDNFMVIESAILLIKETRKKSKLLITEIDKLCKNISYLKKVKSIKLRTTDLTELRNEIK